MISNTQSKWQQYIVTLNEENKMSSSLLQYAVNEFKQNIIFNLEDNQYYHCQLQCRFHIINTGTGMDYYIKRSISYIQFYMKGGEKEQSMLNVFWHFWITFYEDKYDIYLVESICFNYKIVSTNVNEFISPADVKANISPKPLYERINLEPGSGVIFKGEQVLVKEIVQK